MGRRVVGMIIKMGREATGPGPAAYINLNTLVGIWLRHGKKRKKKTRHK